MTCPLCNATDHIHNRHCCTLNDCAPTGQGVDTATHTVKEDTMDTTTATLSAIDRAYFNLRAELKVSVPRVLRLRERHSNALSHRLADYDLKTTPNERRHVDNRVRRYHTEYTAALGALTDRLDDAHERVYALLGTSQGDRETLRKARCLIERARKALNGTRS